MKKIFALFLFLLVAVGRLAAGTFDCEWNFVDFVGEAQVTNKVYITPIAAYGAHANTIVTGDRRAYTNATSSLIVSNLINGRSYRIEFVGKYVTTTITNSFDTNVTGLVNGADPQYLTVPVRDGSTIGFSQAAADARFHKKSGDSSTNATFRGTLKIPAGATVGYVFTVTNADGGGAWQPPAGALDTNAVIGIMANNTAGSASSVSGSVTQQWRGEISSLAADTATLINIQTIAYQAADTALDAKITASTNVLKAAIAAGTVPVAGAAISGNSTNIIYVAKNGSDSNAGTLASPKLSLAGAQSAAVSNQLIYVFAGTYGATNLGKNGVHWYFSPGCILFGNNNASSALFSDNPSWLGNFSDGTNSMVFNIWGHARMPWATNSFAKFGGPNTRVNIELDEAHGPVSINAEQLFVSQINFYDFPELKTLPRANHYLNVRARLLEGCIYLAEGGSEIHANTFSNVLFYFDRDSLMAGPPIKISGSEAYYCAATGGRTIGAPVDFDIPIWRGGGAKTHGGYIFTELANCDSGVLRFNGTTFIQATNAGSRLFTIQGNVNTYAEQDFNNPGYFVFNNCNVVGKFGNTNPLITLGSVRSAYAPSYYVNGQLGYCNITNWTSTVSNVGPGDVVESPALKVYYGQPEATSAGIYPLQFTGQTNQFYVYATNALSLAGWWYYNPTKNSYTNYQFTSTACIWLPPPDDIMVFTNAAHANITTDFLANAPREAFTNNTADQFNDANLDPIATVTAFFAVSTNLTAKKFLVVDGLVSRSTIASVSIAATGWTNIWSTNAATVVYGGTTVSSWKKRAGALTATNITYPVFTGNNTVILQPGQAIVISGTGVSGSAEPLY